MKTLLPFLCLLPVHLLAQGNSTASSHLKFAGSARAAALGQSFISDPGRFSSTSINPANLYADGPVELLLSHTEWILDVRTEQIGTRWPVSFGTFGLAISNTNVGGIELRDRPGPPITTFSARSAVFQLSFARPVTESIIAGGSAKYLFEKIYVDEATGLGFDFGLIYTTPVDGLTLGVALANVGSLNGLLEHSSDLPSEFRAGGVYHTSFEKISLSGGAEYVNETHLSISHLHVGAEIDYDNVGSLRLGYQTGYESRGFTAGIGFRYSSLKLDYAYIPFSLGLGDAHLVTIGFEF